MHSFISTNTNWFVKNITRTRTEQLIKPHTSFVNSPSLLHLIGCPPASHVQILHILHCCLKKTPTITHHSPLSFLFWIVSSLGSYIPLILPYIYIYIYLSPPDLLYYLFLSPPDRLISFPFPTSLPLYIFGQSAPYKLRKVFHHFSWQIFVDPWVYCCKYCHFIGVTHLLNLFLSNY